MFTQTKAEANELYLSEKLKGIEVLHGDIPQQQREITFRGFKEGRFHILVATDVASRGLDIPDVDLIVQCEPPKDVETYIHRSGRTARAGKGGTVITFYTKKHAMMISRIEKLAGISFTKVGAPQPEDIIRASSKFIVEGLKKVSDDALPLFDDTANMLIKEFGEKKSLLLTLAYISGNLNKIKKRSMLAGTEGYVTYQLETDQEFRTMSFVWTILRNLLSSQDVEQIRQMRCYRNSKGAAFDIPEALQPKFESAYEEEKKKQKFMTYAIKKAKELPDLKEIEGLPDGGGFGYGYGSSSGFGRRTQYGNSGPRGDFRGERQNSRSDGVHRSYHHSRPRTRSRSRSRSKSRSKSRSRSPPSPPRNSYYFNSRKETTHTHTEDHSRPAKQGGVNDVFIWGLKTEDDVKDFLADNKVGWKRVKVLTGILFYIARQ